MRQALIPLSMPYSAAMWKMYWHRSCPAPVTATSLDFHRLRSTAHKTASILWLTNETIQWISLKIIASSHVHSVIPTPAIPGTQPRFQSWGSNSLVQGITTLLQKIDRSTQFGAVGYIITLFIEKLAKSWESVQIFGGPDSPTPQWLCPWWEICLLCLRCMVQLFICFPWF